MIKIFPKNSGACGHTCCGHSNKILPKNSGACGQTCCGHSIQSDFTMRLISWRHRSQSHDKNLKGTHSSSKHCILGMGLPCEDQKRITEKRWQEFFSDPSQWWDHRLGKESAGYPDFKHKTTKKGLWLDGKLNPLWVQEKVATMAPGTVQLALFSLNNRLSNYIKAGEFERTLESFKMMQTESRAADSFTFVQAVTACSRLCALEEGKHIHRQIIESGFESDDFVSSSLVHMYVKCGSIDDAVEVFKKMSKHNITAWNAMIQGYVKCGIGWKALELYRSMQQEGVEPSPVTFVVVLNACANMAALEEGKRVHGYIRQKRWESDVFVANSLINMYAKCGSLEDACLVFNKMPAPDVVSWNTLIIGHVKCQKGKDALDLFRRMQLEGVFPDCVTYVGVLNACASVASIEEGMSIHMQLIQRGWESDIFVGTSLVDMYVKCGRMEKAWEVFTTMPTRNVVSWNSIILGFVKSGQGQRALELYQDMQNEGLKPDSVTFMGLVNACAIAVALEEGKQIHEQIIESGLESDLFVSSSLVDMYAKCGSIDDAFRVFDKMPTRDVVAWSAMIFGYVKCGQGQNALKLVQRMRQEGESPNSVTYVGILNACASVGAIEVGRDVHKDLILSNLESDICVGNSLIDMYAKCQSIEDAWRVFTEIPSRDVVSWNTMIMGYAKCGEGHKALELYKKMQKEGHKAVAATFIGAIHACASIEALEDGRKIHEQIIQSGFEFDLCLNCSLIDMYAKCGNTEDSRRVFDKMPIRDVATWNAMIFGYVRCGLGVNAFELFQKMLRESVEPNVASFVGMVNACASVQALEEGRKVDGLLTQRGYKSDVTLCNSLIDMYSKCGSIDDAWTVFQGMATRSVVTWNTMIMGCGRCGLGRKALDIFQFMPQQGLKPVSGTYVGLLYACETLEDGRHVHELIREDGFESDPAVGCSLIDMYGKCGSIEDARRVFNKMPIHGVAAWNAMIMAYENCGQAPKALELYYHIEEEGVQLNPASLRELNTSAFVDWT